MVERATIAASAAEGLRRYAAQGETTPVMVGFDGFIDTILAVVDQRQDVDHYTPMAQIEQLGRRILAAAGQSTNIELVTKLKKLGGNGPIMANALASLGTAVTYVGAVGWPKVDPVFAEFAARAECITVAEPAQTDALEFGDGKLMLGKLTSFTDFDWPRLKDVVGVERMAALWRQSKLVGMVNWTMMPHVTAIWRGMQEEVLPQVEPAWDRLVFIDLTDPEKRRREDLREALAVLKQFERWSDVVLGLNLKEAMQVASVLGVPVGADPEADIERLAVGIRKALDVSAVVIHPRRGAAAARRYADGEDSAVFWGPFVAHPRISTGAGDHFNAGFCLGMLAGLGLPEALCVGTATSGYYVREAVSPSLEQLAEFCANLPAPE